MPKNTRVSDCVDEVKKEGGVNPYAVCQAATGQSYATGKPIKRVKVLAPRVKGLNRRKSMYCMFCGRPFSQHPYLPCPFSRGFRRTLGGGCLPAGGGFARPVPGGESDVGAGEPSVGGGDYGGDYGDHCADGGCDVG